jgi:hypothetical protein
MSKLTKKIEIKERQAEHWMKVCHFAIELFPESFWNENKPIPSESAEIICGLLQELSDSRTNPFIANPDTEYSTEGWAVNKVPTMFEKAMSGLEEFTKDVKLPTDDSDKSGVQKLNDTMRPVWEEYLGFKERDSEEQRRLEFDNVMGLKGMKFNRLREELIKLHLLADDVDDQLVFVAIRDILNAHAPEHRYPKAYEEPSSKV